MAVWWFVRCIPVLMNVICVTVNLPLTEVFSMLNSVYLLSAHTYFVYIPVWIDTRNYVCITLPSAVFS